KREAHWRRASRARMAPARIADGRRDAAASGDQEEAEWAGRRCYASKASHRTGSPGSGGLNATLLWRSGRGLDCWATPAILGDMTDRYGIPGPPFPKTVYRTPNPEWGVSEAYEITIEFVPGAPDPQRCWIVRELHGYYEEATKTYHQKVETLHPKDPR